MPDPRRWNDIATWCWLHDVDVLLSAAMAQDGVGGPTVGAPVRWWWPLRGARTAARAWPGYALQPALRLPPTDFDTRVRRFHRALGAHAPALAEDIDGLAHRFRLAPAAMDAIGRAATVGETLDAPMLRALCRAHSRPDLGGLAHRVEPRFTLDELVLPDAQRRQLDEIAGAMDSLARVHHRWGAARAWNEAGLSVAFCGPPGTGKTMAAEALARALDLPMFRIDLSQVVDKYIGETEKNLQRVFDGAESCECVVFFDEADALFGKRTSVKDAHDRFANIEVSYLLERMERLKGMAILATNRRRDLDEAFLRRLRHLVEFPLPGLAERERLWRGMFPPGVDTDALDFAALAGLFPLAGGHIRSIAFNACLQAARESDARVDMAAVLRATKRELDKLHRPNAPEDFGAHADIVRPLFAEAQT